MRTSHLTGIVTDLDLMLGSAIRGRAFDRRKDLLFLIIVSGFVVGGAIGAWLFAWFHFAALAIPASICFLLALAYRLYCSLPLLRRSRPDAPRKRPPCLSERHPGALAPKPKKPPTARPKIEKNP